MLKRMHTIFALIFGIFLINVGILHFTDTSWFEPIVPRLLGFPTFWVIISGVMEIILGVGLIIHKIRQMAAKCTAIFLMIIYSANLNMWIYDIKLGDGTYLTGTGHVICLFAQILMIILNLWISKQKTWLELKSEWIK